MYPPIPTFSPLCVCEREEVFDKNYYSFEAANSMLSMEQSKIL